MKFLKTFTAEKEPSGSLCKFALAILCTDLSLKKKLREGIVRVSLGILSIRRKVFINLELSEELEKKKFAISLIIRYCEDFFLKGVIKERHSLN